MGTGALEAGAPFFLLTRRIQLNKGLFAMFGIRPFFLSLSATLTLSFFLFRNAAHWGFVDLPDHRKVHSIPTPRTGGLAMISSSALTVGLAWGLGWMQFPSLPWQTWVAGFGFMAIGTLDDRFNLANRRKFIALLILSFLAAWPWMWGTMPNWMPSRGTFPILGLLIRPAVGFLLTFWFMALPNAINIEDAINGYMGGFTLLILLGLAYHGLAVSILIGALVGFLVFNWPRAKHFMGDAGSFGCGFILAEAILRGGGLEHPSMALALTAPVSLDVAMGLVRRHRLGMSFFEADRSTCPHHLLNALNGAALLATPILWLNAAGFVGLARHPWLALVQALGYLALLVYFNRSHLFKGSSRSLDS